MLNYSYSAKSLTDGRVEKGKTTAENLSQAIQKLKSSGLTPIKITEIKSSSFNLSIIFKKVPANEKIIFTRQLATMIKAGLPLVKAIDSMKSQSSNEYFKSILTQIAMDLKGGILLSKSLAKYPKTFSDIYVSIVRTGEQTGQLSEVLFELAKQQEKDADLISKVRGAMIYPIIILVALISVVILILVFVLPSLQAVFNDANVQLPFATRILLGSSGFTIHYYWLMIIIFIGLYFFIRFYLKTTRGKLIYDKLKIKLPVFGALTTRVYMARFSRTTATLVKSSVPILEAMKIVRQTINNIHYHQAFDRISKSIEGGDTIAKSLQKEPLFPPMVTQLISLGEESGNVETSLQEVAEFYEKEVDNLTKNLATMIEPIMMIVMGLGVAFVVAAVLGPIYGLVQAY